MQCSVFAPHLQGGVHPIPRLGCHYGPQKVLLAAVVGMQEVLQANMSTSTMCMCLFSISFQVSHTRPGRVLKLGVLETDDREVYGFISRWLQVIVVAFLHSSKNGCRQEEHGAGNMGQRASGRSSTRPQRRMAPTMLPEHPPPHLQHLKHLHGCMHGQHTGSCWHVWVIIWFKHEVAVAVLHGKPTWVLVGASGCMWAHVGARAGLSA